MAEACAIVGGVEMHSVDGTAARICAQISAHRMVVINLHSYGLSCRLYSYDLYSHGLYSYGLCILSAYMYGCD